MEAVCGPAVRLGLCPDGPTEHEIEEVSDPRGAIVAEVLVRVLAVLRKRVAIGEVAERDLLRGGEVELLRNDFTSRLRVPVAVSSTRSALWP